MPSELWFVRCSPRAEFPRRDRLPSPPRVGVDLSGLLGAFEPEEFLFGTSTFLPALTVALGCPFGAALLYLVSLVARPSRVWEPPVLYEPRSPPYLVLPEYELVSAPAMSGTMHCPWYCVLPNTPSLCPPLLFWFSMYCVNSSQRHKTM